MSIPPALTDLLDRSGVRYEIRAHRPAFTAQEIAEAEHVPGAHVAKVVMVRAGGDFLMAVLPAPAHVSLERLGAAVGRTDLHLATEAEFAHLFPGCDPGAMPPFGNLYGVPVWVEESLAQDEEIVMNAGDHEHTLHMRYADFARLVRPRVAAFRPPAA